MSRIVDLVVRLLIILAGYAAAALAASFFLHLVVWPLLGFRSEEMAYAFAGGIVFSVPLISLFIAYFAFIPFVVLGGLAEIMGYRSWLFHTLAGGAAGLAVVVLFRQYGVPDDVSTAPDAYGEVPLALMPEAMLAVVGGGLAGGFVYWLIAGRSAGLWLDRVPHAGSTTGPGPSGS